MKRGNANSTPEKNAVVHWVAGEEPYRWKWGVLMAAASRFTALLSDAGVRKGDVCAIIVGQAGYREEH